MEKPNLPNVLPDKIEDKMRAAKTWFEALRDSICHSLEKIEDELTGPLTEQPAGRFERTRWKRPGGEGSKPVQRQGVDSVKIVERSTIK